VIALQRSGVMRKAKVIPAAVRVRRLAATAIAAYPAAVSLPIDGTSLRGVVEHLVGRHWVEELVLEGPPDPALIDVTLELARQAGRGLAVHAAVNQLDLPPALEGERWSRIAGGWRLSVARAGSMTLLVKRVVDVAVSAVLLALLSPLMLAVALAVLASSPGPVFYRSRVLGSFGRPVAGYKFRTMCDGADRNPRVTRVGRVLRRYSIDELPQLWSVLKGDLSLVGPRPPSREEYANLDLWQMRQLTVKPGITRSWQVIAPNFAPLAPTRRFKPPGYASLAPTVRKELSRRTPPLD
jgi:lipopolysaccharide/colanic/teichoic acid biosynthesis glycosyltransferase